MPTLYYTNASCSQSAFIAAKIAGVKGLDFDSVHFDWTTGDHKTGSGKSFKSINPKGNVPALLLDDGTVLAEGPSVHLWLAQQAPEAGLFPADRSSVAFLKAIEAFNYIGTDCHAGSIALLFSPLASQAAEINKKLSGKFDFLAANWLKGKHCEEHTSKPCAKVPHAHTH
jgi:glutathione S-transferase